MSYTKQNFRDGQTLTAEMLNKIERGIVDNETALADKQPKGEYLTEHQKIKTINGQSLVGEGDITIESEEVDLSGYATTAYIIEIFEELKSLIQAGDSEAAIATLDNAILDLTTLA